MPHKRGHFPKHQNIDTVNYLKKYRLACRKPCLSTLLEFIPIIKFLLSFSNQHQITHINWHKKDHKENQAVGISTIGTQWDQTQTGKMAPYLKGVLKKFIFLFYLVGLHKMKHDWWSEGEPKLTVIKALTLSTWWELHHHCHHKEAFLNSLAGLPGPLASPMTKVTGFLASDFALTPTAVGHRTRPSAALRTQP
jgi:hypothetical protein